MNAIDGAPCKLTVCRGCCCGTKKKVPGVDHKAQLARLSVIDDHSARRVPVRTSKCLGICFQANVVVVQPSQEGRAAGGRPVWLGRMTGDKLLDAVDDWIFDGGPGIAPLPTELEDRVTSKDAKKPKKRKHDASAKKERKKAKEKLAEQARKDMKTREKAQRKAREKAEEKAQRKAREKAEEKAQRKAAEAVWSEIGPPHRPKKNKAEKARADERGKAKKGKAKKGKAGGKKSPEGKG